jgi:hypothetical protein
MTGVREGRKEGVEVTRGLRERVKHRGKATDYLRIICRDETDETPSYRRQKKSPDGAELFPSGDVM